MSDIRYFISNNLKYVGYSDIQTQKFNIEFELAYSNVESNHQIFGSSDSFAQLFPSHSQNEVGLGKHNLRDLNDKINGVFPLFKP